jgi:hypothetical protein
MGTVVSTTSVQTAIAAWQAHQISGTQLLRQLIAFDAWMAPVAQSAVAEMVGSNAAPRVMYSQAPQGVARLYLFSSAAAWETFQQTAGGAPPATGQHFLTTTGRWVFRLPTDQVDFLEIDPGSPWHINYSQAQFPRLHALAEAVEIEGALLALRRGNAPDGTAVQVRGYEHYLLAIARQGDQTKLALAPDSQGRALAAIFTAPDNFDAFVEARQSSPEEGQLLSLEMAGDALFRQLAGMRLDGLVFNCCGPAQAVAFASALAAVILEA